ncbi:predicted protein [Naegleria gruberi]|uniref:Predicted protein n=1 Tax=Naegleria gruberi TaxID=5762 RepID=D2UXS2_NAEGR|nr:uncharacterized protein NAEGRDRAFT_45003 [Naegleria gruberi]EFC50339.1 predicted protein [Naegleria gruberi]|eukprot:XP_002683083.1 predicted protein [Naegleria gruberi strain NEG-M]
MFILSFEEKSKILEQQHNEKMMELCRRLKIQQDLQDQYDQQTTTIQQQERLINNLKHKIREIETSLFDTESRIREKERENRELRSENSDLWREKKDISKTRDKILELEQEIRIRDEKINAFPRDIEKQKIEYENNIQEAEIRVKKLEFMKDKEHESKMKEIKEYYLKKQKELNDTVKELSRGKSLISNKKKSKNIAQDSDNDFLKDELFAKQATIEELMKKITEIESRNEGKELSNNETSVIREGNINEESELIGELRIVRLEKEELLRKLELSEMNKVFIKENAMEQVKAAYSELNTTREKYRNEIQNLEERHNQEMKCQESHFLQEIEDYKNIIDNSATKQTHTLQLINENSGENSRILMLKQLISRIENLESKHKIKEMELERELNETRYRYELKITSMKQHLDLTVQQKNQQVLQLKTSLDNLVQAFQKLKIAQRENLF